MTRSSQRLFSPRHRQCLHICICRAILLTYKKGHLIYFWLSYLINKHGASKCFDENILYIESLYTTCRIASDLLSYQAKTIIFFILQSHAFGKARWVGLCPLSECGLAVQCYPSPRPPTVAPQALAPMDPATLPPMAPAPASPLPHHCSAAARLAHDLCQRLEKLSSQERPS